MRLVLLAALAACKGGPTEPTDAGDVYAGIAFDGSAETGVLLGIWSDGDEAILVGGDLRAEGRITRYDGERFCVESETYEHALWWAHGRAEGEWYAVGERGIIVHEDNGTRTREDVSTLATLFGVYDDGTDVWAVGGDVLDTQTGEIWRKPAGGEWEALRTGIDGLMFKVHDNWFVGDGVAFYWNGSELEERMPPTLEGATRPPKLLTVRSFGPDRAFAVGGTSRPVMLEWADGAWSPIEVDFDCSGGQGLNGVMGSSPDALYIAGFQGAAARYDGSWTCDVPPRTEQHFHVAWEHQGEVLYAGGDLFDVEENHGTVAIHPDKGSVPVEVCN